MRAPQEREAARECYDPGKIEWAKPVLNLIDVRAILIVALIFIPLETLFPLRAQQKLLRRHWLNDVVYLVLNGVLINLGLLVVLALFMAAIHLTVPSAVETAVQRQPVWLQTVEALILADLGFYFAHRAFHAIPFLWQFHCIHHSIEELDWLAGFRVHPLDQVLTKSASYLPLLALGFSMPAIAICVLIYRWQSIAIHSNSRIGLGPLKWVFASPQFHHWHHAREPAARDRNFAGQLVFIDAIGGTLFMPNRMPAAYGTELPVPDRYYEQLVYPLLGGPRPVPSDGRQKAR